MAAPRAPQAPKVPGPSARSGAVAPPWRSAPRSARGPAAVASLGKMGMGGFHGEFLGL